MTDEPLEHIDTHFARFIGQTAGSQDPDLIMSAALVSRATRNGNVCLHLRQHAGKRVTLPGVSASPHTLPAFDTWCRQLMRQPVVGKPGEYCPLVLDDVGRLYLYRYWAYERGLAQALLARTCAKDPVIDHQCLRESLQRHYQRQPGAAFDAQCIASAVAVLKRLCIVVGGPGTGKTTAIARMLAVLLEQPLQPPPRIMLATPTGKAAAQMQATLRHLKSELNSPPHIRDAIPETVETIHRLLQPISGSPYFRHDHQNPIPAEVLVVDEASMVDLPLMYKLLQALSASARLILVGDRDQLASVEAGAVLGDICDPTHMHTFTAPLQQSLVALGAMEIEACHGSDTDPPAMADHIVVLDRPHRFEVEGGIGRLSRAVNQGRSAKTLALLQDGALTDIEWIPDTEPERLLARLAQFVIQGYRNYLASDDPHQALEKLQSFQVLCAVNHGRWGVDAINRLATATLAADGLIATRTASSWYAGRPVMITRNDHQLDLFNGDIGVTWPARQAGHRAFRVYFKGPGRTYRKFAPHRLPPHQTVYATTVHKSQGSEFDHVVLVLPAQDQKVLTRELLYTAITRARKRFTLCGASKVIEKMVLRPIARSSGLHSLLWSPGLLAEDAAD
jgi:exodeoxyribonuclease V alpha subunit